MIIDIYERFEEKRKEVEDYIEEKIPLKKYINKYKLIFILIFIFIIIYFYLWIFDPFLNVIEKDNIKTSYFSEKNNKKNIIGGYDQEQALSNITNRISNTIATSSNKVEKQKESEGEKPEIPIITEKQAKKKIKEAKKREESSARISELNEQYRYKINKEETEANSILQEADKIKRIKRKQSLGYKLSSNEEDILKKEPKISKKKKELTDKLKKEEEKKKGFINKINKIKTETDNIIKFKIITEIQKKLTPIVGSTTASLISNFIYKSLFSLYYKFTSLFSNSFGYFSIFKIIWKVFIIIFLLIILIIIGIYIPILFFLSTFFIVLKKIINGIQTYI
jgi:hypothetical protein